MEPTRTSVATESAGQAESKKYTRLVSSSASAMPNVIRHAILRKENMLEGNLGVKLMSNSVFLFSLCC